MTPLVAAETADTVGSPWAADEVVWWSVCCPWTGPFHPLSAVLCSSSPTSSGCFKVQQIEGPLDSSFCTSKVDFSGTMSLLFSYFILCG